MNIIRPAILLAAMVLSGAPTWATLGAVFIYSELDEIAVHLGARKP